MDIKKKVSNREIMLKNVKQGTVFMSGGGNYFLKTEDVRREGSGCMSSPNNAVSLSDGNCYNFNDTERVTPIVADFVIRKEKTVNS